jgi:hypothetical protein
MIVYVVRVQTELGDQFTWSYPNAFGIRDALEQWLKDPDTFTGSPVKTMEIFKKNSQEVTQRP